MDEETIKRALGEVLASELKIIKEHVSVIPSMQHDIRDLKEGQERMHIDIDILKVTARSHTKAIGELKTDVAELKTDVTELKTDVAGLHASMNRVETKIERHGESIAELKRRAS